VTRGSVEATGRCASASENDGDSRHSIEITLAADW